MIGGEQRRRWRKEEGKEEEEEDVGEVGGMEVIGDEPRLMVLNLAKGECACVHARVCERDSQETC